VEHLAFIEGLRQFGRDWRKVSSLVSTVRDRHGLDMPSKRSLNRRSPRGQWFRSALMLKSTTKS
jgi:hypothetical protein